MIEATTRRLVSYADMRMTPDFLRDYRDHLVKVLKEIREQRNCASDPAWMRAALLIEAAIDKVERRLKQ